MLSLNLVPQVLDPLLDLLGFLQIIPETVGGALRLQHLSLPGGGFQPQGLVQIVQLRAEVIQFHLVFIKL